MALRVTKTNGDYYLIYLREHRKAWLTLYKFEDLESIFEQRAAHIW